MNWRNYLYKRHQELETHGEAAFPGKGGCAHRTDELTRLLRENVRLREERDILKKSAVGSGDQRNTIWGTVGVEGDRHELSLHPCASDRAPHSDRARSGSRGSARVSFHSFHRARSVRKKGTWPLPPHPSEAARCASTEDHQAPSSPFIDSSPSPPYNDNAAR